MCLHVSRVGVPFSRILSFQSFAQWVLVHEREAMAPLKRGPGARCRRHSASLRNCTVMAPLELCSQVTFQAPYHPVRDLLAQATPPEFDILHAPARSAPVRCRASTSGCIFKHRPVSCSCPMHTRPEGHRNQSASGTRQLSAIQKGWDCQGAGSDTTYRFWASK